jgi:hypothetical protein
MTAILGTLPFIATLWLLAVLGAAVLEESGAKITAALKGEAMKLPTIGSGPARVWGRPVTRRVICANEPFRAAA